MKSQWIAAKDRTRLHLRVDGEGPALLMLPGGGFSSDIFEHQIKAFAPHFQVLALSMRGHGESDRSPKGMTMIQLAEDLHDVLEALNLSELDILAHSLGCSVVYQYIDLYGTSPFSKLILVDESPVPTINPAWSEEERLQYGATYDPSEISHLIKQMTPQDFPKLKKEMVSAMTTSNASQKNRQFIENCLSIKPEDAAILYRDNLSHDWRRIAPNIDKPTLLIGGRASITPWQSQEWLHEQIKGSQLQIFEENEGGSHFMFVENPSLFHRIAVDFLS